FRFRLRLGVCSLVSQDVVEVDVVLAVVLANLGLDIDLLFASNLDRTNLGYRDTNLSLLGLVDVVLTVGHCLLELSHTHLAVRQSNKESVQLVNLRNESPRRRVGRD